MQIETKFNVNQKVFCVDKERRLIKKPCNMKQLNCQMKLFKSVWIMARGISVKRFIKMEKSIYLHMEMQTL